MAILVALVAGIALPDPALKPVVVLRGVEMRVDDLIDVRLYPLPEDVASRVVMRLPRTMVLPAPKVAALVRRRVPGLRIATPATGSFVRISIRPQVASRRPTNCFAAARAIAAGESLRRGDVETVPCRADAALPKFLYEAQSRTPSSAQPIAAGSYLGQLAPLPVAHVAKGQQLTLRSTAGPVTVERSVTALQSAGAARRLFVRDVGGKVFSAPLAIEAGQGAR